MFSNPKIKELFKDDLRSILSKLRKDFYLEMNGIHDITTGEVSFY